MTETILCATEVEPGGFHADDTLAVSVRLAFETDDRENAKQLHRGFLEDLASRRFVAVDVLAPGAPVLFEVEPTPNVFDGFLAIDRFLPWLEERAGTGLHETTGSGDQQIDVGANDVQTGEARSVPAGPVVLSAAGWTAPLPQKLGLSSIAPFAASDLELPAADDGTKAYVVVPVFGVEPLWALEIDPAKVKVEGEGKDRIATFTYRAKKGEEPRACRTNVLFAPKSDETSLVDPATGFLRNYDSARHLHRIVGEVERKGGSLLATLSAAMRIQLDPPEPPESDGTGREHDEARLRHLAWQAMACLLGALDPIVIALTMPHPPGAKPRLGPLLSPLSNALRKRLDERLKKNETPFPRPTQDQLGAALRAGIATLRVLPGGTGQDGTTVGPFPQTIAERARLVRDLGSLLLPQDAKTVALSIPGNVQAAGDLWVTADALRKEKATAVLPWLQAVYVLDGFSIPGPSQENGTHRPDIVIIDVIRDALNAELGAQLLDSTKTHTLDELAAATGLPLRARLAQELAPLVDAATAESAVEGAITRLLSEGAIRDPAQPPDAFVAKMCAGLGLADKPEFKADVIAARQDFLDLLAGPFNGAEAVRQACSAVFLDHLMEGWQPIPDDDLGEKTAKAARDRLTGTRYFAERFQAVAPPLNPPPPPSPAPSPFAPIIARLVRPSDRPSRWSEIGTILGEALKTAAGELFPAGDGRRFTPSHKPEDIPLQITLDDSTEDGDEFEKRLAGVSLLVRREDGGTNDARDWFHANLAAVTVRADKPADEIHLGGSVAPLQSVLVDGRRQLFLTYAGLPFTAAAFADSTPVVDASETRKPFFTVDSPVANTVPTLAYKSLIEVAGFAVSSGGSVPDLIRGGEPWQVKATLPAGSLPKPDDAAAAQGWTFKHSYRYERTTAIGTTAIVEGGASAGPTATGRIGAVPEGVRPLSHDYPRLSLTSQSSLDLFRRPDGTGELAPVPKEPIRIVLRDFRREGEGPLAVEAHARPDVPFDWDPASGSGATVDAPPRPDGAVALVIQVTVEEGSLTLTVEFVDGAGRAVGETRPSDPVALPAPKEGQSTPPGIWVRLRLKAETSTSVSFADPAAARPGGSRPGGDSLLLLAPKTEEKSWVAALRQEVMASIQRPRVGHVDLERWLANPELARLVMIRPGVQETDATLLKRTEAFRKVLYGASILRTLGPDRAERLDRLPDPAVSHLLIELSCVDDLGDGKSPAPKPERRIVPLPTLGELIVRAQERLEEERRKRHQKELERNPHAPPPGEPDPDDLLRLIEGEAVSLTISSQETGLKLRPDQDEVNSGIEAVVPAGMAARLTVRPLVAEGLVGKGTAPAALAAIDGRMRQLALGRTAFKTVPYLIFEGATLLVEAMLDGLTDADNWPAIVDRALRVVPEAGARAYTLDLETGTEAKDHQAWRMVSSVDIDTQRWRFMGRPIYHWIKPSDGRSPNAAVQILGGDKPPVSPHQSQVAPDALAQFEAEAFAGRPALDAEPSTAQVAPLPARSRIARVEWGKPTATLFRHRIAVRSRYAGALTSPEARTRKAWLPLSQDGRQRIPEDWVRVAMLAERPRAPLTRPQVRALMPLTTNPGGGNASPPALAMLQEEPFGTGGLAERVAAEVPLSVGYEMRGTGPTARLLPADTRQQEGPDPRLSFARAGPENALALAAEGPIGLTFEPGVPAPAFPNMAFVLQPMELDEAARPRPSRNAERFVGVALRRYLDPHWVVGGKNDADLAESWWLDIDAERDGDIMKVDDLVCCRIERGASLKVQVDRRIVDPTLTLDDLKPAPGEDELKYLTIATIPAHDGIRLALLHVPLEPGRWSMSVVLLPQVAEANASGDQPLVLASIDWSLLQDAARPGKLEVAGRTLCIAASPVTDLAWVRTSKDFELVHAVAANPTPEPIHARDLIALWEKNKFGLQFARKTVKNDKTINYESVLPVASLAAARQPLHVQRHLGLLYTDVLADLGLPPLEQPRVPARHLVMAGQALLDTGRKLPDQVRVVEFETPAAVFGVMPGKELPASLQEAYFDLHAIGHRPGEGLLLAIRLTASSATLGSLGAITFALKAFKADGGSDISTVTVGIDREGKAAEVRWLYLALQAGTGAATWSAVGTLGQPVTVRPDGVTPLQAVVAASPGFTLRAMALAGGPNECWFDASLLTAPPGGALNVIDFDWFLRSEPVEPEPATTPEALSTMTEAQARIISVSPPIRVLEKSRQEVNP